MGLFQHEPRVPDKGGLLGTFQAGQSYCDCINAMDMKLSRHVTSLGLPP